MSVTLLLNGLHVYPQTTKKVLIILVGHTERDCQRGQCFMCIITNLKRSKGVHENLPELNCKQACTILSFISL